MVLDKQGLGGISSELYEYVQAHNVLGAELEGVRRETEGLQNSFWQVAPEQAVFMGQLAELIDARKVLEVGTYTGLSALAIAAHLPEDGKLVACDIDFGPFEQVGRKYANVMGVEHKLDLREGPALDTMRQEIDNKQDGTYDMLFIDGAKNEYPAYYQLGKQLLRTKGLMIVDNMFGMGGQVVDHDVNDPRIEGIRSAAAMMRDDRQAGLIRLSMLRESDGIALVTKLAA